MESFNRPSKIKDATKDSIPAFSPKSNKSWRKKKTHKNLHRSREISGAKRERKSRTGVGHGDFVDLIGIEPDLASPALENAGGEPLLKLQRYHGFSSQPETRESSEWRDTSFYIIWRLLRVRVLCGWVVSGQPRLELWMWNRLGWA